MFGHRFFGERYFGPRYWGDGGDAAAEDTLVGRRRRRRVWDSVLAQSDVPSAAEVAKEREIVEQMLLAAELDQLIDERKILRAALETAAARQAKAIDALVGRVSRRIDDLIEDDDITLMLL